MSTAWRGDAGSGSVLVYQVPRDHELRLELLTFTLTTNNTAGVHSALVTFTDGSLGQITARLWDWNEGGGNMTLYYTYGIGLQDFNCTVTGGMMIEHRLPDTVLAPETEITVAGVDNTCAVISGDQIGSVVLSGLLIDTVQSGPAQQLELIGGLLPGSTD